MALYEKCMAATRIVRGEQYAHELCQASAYGNIGQMMGVRSKTRSKSRSNTRSKSRRNRGRASRAR